MVRRSCTTELADYTRKTKRTRKAWGAVQKACTPKGYEHAIFTERGASSRRCKKAVATHGRIFNSVYAAAQKHQNCVAKLRRDADYYD